MHQRRGIKLEGDVSSADAFPASAINLHHFQGRREDALSAVLKQKDLADQLVKKRKALSLHCLLLSFMVSWENRKGKSNTNTAQWHSEPLFQSRLGDFLLQRLNPPASALPTRVSFLPVTLGFSHMLGGLTCRSHRARSCHFSGCSLQVLYFI